MVEAVCVGSLLKRTTFWRWNWKLLTPICSGHIVWEILPKLALPKRNRLSKHFLFSLFFFSKFEIFPSSSLLFPFLMSFCANFTVHFACILLLRFFYSQFNEISSYHPIIITFYFNSLFEYSSKMNPPSTPLNVPPPACPKCNRDHASATLCSLFECYRCWLCAHVHCNHVKMSG